MTRIRRTTLGLATMGLLALVTAAPAAAVFSVIQTDLTGPDIGGRTPRGTATVNQSQLPAPGTLDLRVSHVNLPDGTVLTVEITDCESFTGSPVVGTVTLENGRARATITLPSEPSVCQVGHNSSIFLKLADGTMVLEGGSPWEVRRA
jgi:hypothetical protein